MEILIQSRSKAKRGLLEAVVGFYKQKLKLQRSRYNIIVTTINGFSKATGMNGATALIDHETIAIAIDSRLDIEKCLTVLAHEMVHVKQYALGQLKYTFIDNEVVYYWCGKEFHTEYYESPWELEAFGRERILANGIAQLLIKDK